MTYRTEKEGKLIYSERLSTIEGLNDKKYSASQINMNVKGVYVIQLITAEGIQKLKVIKKISLSAIARNPHKKQSCYTTL